MYTFISFISLVILTAVNAAQAFPAWGAVSGGGGVGVLCLNSGQQTLKTLDLFELEKSGRNTFGSQIDIEKDYLIAINRLRFLVKDFRPITNEEITFFQEMFNSINFTDQELKPTDDIGSTVPLPENCKYKQIAYYDDHQNRLIVNRALWGTLDSINQAALLVHEAIYREQRKAFYNNSSYGRKLVAELFAENGPAFKGAYDGLIKDKGVMCFAGESGTNSDIVFVWQDNQIHLISVAGEPRFVKTTINIPVSASEVQLEAELIDNSYVVNKVITTPISFEIKGQKIVSELPISHIEWLQEFKANEIFRVGLKVKGALLMYPVKSCFPY